ncbi:hypothetical protein E4U40_002983 [Claviceps sp. LM458 group G5]|nr:hypothetical protein E4U40_002983 [Claviceps sp. LM458 group G5]
MSQFRAKKLDLGCFVKIRTIRDHTKRKVFEQFEAERQALRYVIRNTTLPPRVRATAQLQLASMHSYTRPTQIRNRCIMGGKGRGVLSDFKMTRVSFPSTSSSSNMRQWQAANRLVVQLQVTGYGGEHSGSEESELVE